MLGPGDHVTWLYVTLAITDGIVWVYLWRRERNARK